MVNSSRFYPVKQAFSRPYSYFSWPISVLIILILLFAIFREPIFRHLLDQKIDKFNKEHHASISYESVTFSGFTGISLHHITINEIGNTPLFSAKKMDVRISFWKLFRKRISIEDIKMDSCAINIVKNGSQNNYRFLFQSAKNEEKTESQEQKLSSIANRISNMLFDLIPQKMEISNLTISITSQNHHFAIEVPIFTIIDHQFSNKFQIIESGIKSTVFAIGNANKEENEFSLKLFGEAHQPIKIPWLEYRNEATICLDTLFFKLRNIPSNNEEVEKIEGSVSGKKLVIFQKRVATDTIKFDEIGTHFIFNIGDNWMEIDSSSTVDINHLELNPYVYYRPKPTKKVILSLNKPYFESQLLFNALPKGLFDNFSGIKVSGQLAYHGYLEIDLSLPDSMVFESDLSQKNFKIVKAGATDFTKINASFEHRVFENDKEVKTIEVGPSNRNFIPFEKIPISLKNAILMSEDGWFFEHGGFLLGAFRQSIITNIKTKRFSRGGSTISMQLIKNVFLNRNKNIARKLEELLIVWIIEKNRLVSKERMFEIYVNIIEWGPSVYGLSEAAKFYFNKEASELTLDESIFLAAIIPSPKHFRFLFNADGSFKDYIINYYQLVLKRMVERELILQSDADGCKQKVLLLGNAKDYSKTKTDSLVIETVIENKEGLLKI